MEKKFNFVLNVKNWQDFLPDEKTLLKLLGYALGTNIIKLFENEPWFKENKEAIENTETPQFLHPIAGINRTENLLKLVEYLSKNGLRLNKRTKSISHLVFKFLKVISNLFNTDFDELKKSWYGIFVKDLTDFVKIPEGAILIEEHEPLDYFYWATDNMVEDSYRQNKGFFGDMESCFINDSNKHYVWDLLENNEGKVVTVKVFPSEEDLKIYLEAPTLKYLSDLYFGGARFLLYKTSAEINDFDTELWVTHNAYSYRIPFTPYFWYIILKEYFKNKYGIRARIWGYHFDAMRFLHTLGENFLYINDNTNGLPFIGFVASIDPKVLKSSSMQEAINNSVYKLYMNCPICGEKTDYLYCIEVEHGEYYSIRGSYGGVIVGCSSCIEGNLKEYLEYIHSESLKDFNAYVEYQRISGSCEYDDIYYNNEEEEEYEY